MKVNKPIWGLLLLGLGVVIGLPVAGHLLRGSREARCATDGTKIECVYRVTIAGGGGGVREFCCVRCAELWFNRQKVRPRSVTVTDEVTGDAIDAEAAWYVRSLVVNVPTSGNRIHVFRNREQAMKHADAHSGVILSEKDKPFRPFIKGN